MKKYILLSVLFVFFATSLEVFGVDEKQIYRSVLKIRTYEYNSTNNTYSISQEGSAVALGSGLILTNAHVVFNSTTGSPDGFYEICRTIDFRKKAVCFTTGELFAYDEANDLAMLSFQQPSDISAAPLFTERKIDIGAPVIVYGYPSIGGENISRTEGNVAGYEDPFYKIDGAIDHGNSGGGAFNKFGQLLGIPSRVSSDNAVIGYMIPITTIRDFIGKKSKGYVAMRFIVPPDFKNFIKNSELGEKSNDIINDANIKTASLKRYGLSFVGKIEGIGQFIYAMSMSNLRESSVSFGCYRLGGVLNLAELDIREVGDALKKFKVTDTKAGKNGQYLVRKLESLISSEGRDLIGIYDTRNSCSAAINRVTIRKDKKIIDQAMAFVTSGILFKKSYPQTIGFDTQLFHIDRIPTGVSVRESASQGGESTIELGYFSPVSNSGESLSELVQKQKDTLDGYFLGGKSYLDDSPSDPNLKPSEYSYETFKRIYEKKYSEKGFTNTSFAIEHTKNDKKYIIGTTDYRSETSKDNSVTSVIIFSYPYMTVKGDKKEYRELTYMNTYKGGNSQAISSLKDFFSKVEFIGSAPF